MRLDTRLKTL
jgi:hypothetical protein